MARLSVSEAAERLGVNVQRVHQLVAEGALPAERVGRHWILEEADLVRLDRRPPGRPLSPKSAWALAIMAAVDAGSPALEKASSRALSRIAAPDRSKARARLRALLDESQFSPGDEEAALSLAASLRGLLQNRAERHGFKAAARDLDDLRADSRVILSGVSLPDSGIASADIVEGYVSRAEFDSVVDDYLLSKARPPEANVVLHAFGDLAHFDVDLQADNWLVLAADLAEHHRPREVARAVEIVREVAVQQAARKSARSR